MSEVQENVRGCILSTQRPATNARTKNAGKLSEVISHVQVRGPCPTREINTEMPY
jgi:hypothetical protein